MEIKDKLDKYKVNSVSIGFCTKIKSILKETESKAEEIYIHNFLKKPKIYKNEFVYSKIKIRQDQFYILDVKELVYIFSIKDIHKICRCSLNQNIIEIHFNGYFEVAILEDNIYCSPSKNYFLKEFGYDLDNRLFECKSFFNWLSQPILRIEFNPSETGVNDFLRKINGMNDFKNRQKFNYFRKINKNVFKAEAMIKFDNKIFSVLKNYRNEIESKLNMLDLDIVFGIQSLFTSNFFYRPLDIPLNFIDFFYTIGLTYDNFVNNYQTQKSDYRISKNDSVLKNYDLASIKREILTLFTNFQIERKDNEYLYSVLQKYIAEMLVYPSHSHNLHNKSFNNVHSIIKYKRKTKDNNLKIIKRVFVSPIRSYFRYEYLYETNRILEQIKDRTNFLIILNIVDKYKKQIQLPEKQKYYLRSIKLILKEGIQMGKYNFKFFSYSNSQIREHALYMLLQNSEINANSIFKNLGNFEKCTNIANFLSCRALGLTTSIPFKEIKNVVYIKDIKYEFDEGDYNKNAAKGLYKETLNFSDGVGQISFDLALEISKTLFDCPGSKFYSAFQIRFGGYKGVLAVNPNLEDQTICLRPSMKKFESKDNMLFIVKPATYKSGYLNKQLISLLSSCGIENEVFLNLLDKDLGKYKKDLNSIFSNNDYTYNKVSSFIKHLVDATTKSGINKYNLMQNPFFQGLYLTVLSQKLNKLKTKNNLYDSLSGRFIGIIDEFSILRRDEVFLQVSGSINRVIQGKVLIGRNPCNYSGDIQVMKAMSDDFLKKYFFDVIIFPTKSPRPIQQLIAAGDLDGDEYYVTWNSSLIPKHLKPGYPNNDILSLDYIEKILIVNKLELCNNVAKDVPKNEQDFYDYSIDFFMNYLKFNNLGRLCNTHLALFDKNNFEKSQTINILSILQRKSFTFFKTGSYSKEFDICKVKEFPDYMEKKDKKTYKSKTILGILYRKIKDEYEKALDQSDEYFSDINSIKQWNNDCLVFLNPGFELFIDISWLLYEMYYDELNSNLNKFHFYREYEFFCFPLINCDKVKRNSKYTDHSETLKYFTDRYQQFFDSISKRIYTLFCRIYPKFDKCNELMKEEIICCYKEYSSKYNYIFNTQMKKFIYDLDNYEDEAENYFFKVYTFKNENLMLEIKKSLISAMYYCSNYFQMRFSPLVKEFTYNYSLLQSSNANLQKHFTPFSDKSYLYENLSHKYSNAKSYNWAYNYFSFPWVLDCKTLLKTHVE